MKSTIIYLTLLLGIGQLFAQDIHLSSKTEPSARELDKRHASNHIPKLSDQKVAEVLGMRLGEWTAVEKGKTEAFDEFVCRWKIKGESIVATTRKGFTFTMFHDPELGVFVGKMVSPDGNEMIRHGRWDRSTRTLTLRVVSPQPPPGVVPIMTLKKTEPDTIVSKFVVRKEGEIVFTRDAVITRKKKDFAPEPKLPAIGFSVLFLSNPYCEEMVAGMQEEADQGGAELLVEDANFDSNKLSDQIDAFIAQKVKAIVLAPMGPAAVGPAIKRANSAGIPVFTIDFECTAEGVQITGHVGNDNYQGGQLAGQAMIEALGPKGGEVLVLGFGGANACVLRVKGFKEVIDAHNQKGEGGAIEIVAEADGGANQGKSQEATGDALIDHPDLAGIFAINDPSALGAYQAAKAAGKEKQVKVIGFDGTKQGRDAIKAGKIYAAPIQFPDRMGRRVIENVFAHLTGKEFNQVEFVPTEIYRQEDALAEEKQASVQAPVAAGSLEDNIRGKRIVFGQIGSKDGILQFNEDGTFKVGQLVWGPSAVSPQRIKFEQEQETATYKVSGLKVSVKADQEDNFITFKNNNPKKRGQYLFWKCPISFSHPKNRE